MRFPPLEQGSFSSGTHAGRSSSTIPLADSRLDPRPLNCSCLLKAWQSYIENLPPSLHESRRIGWLGRGLATHCGSILSSEHEPAFRTSLVLV